MTRSQSSATMRAFVVVAPGVGEVRDVPRPIPGSGEVVVDVERVGVCGTDLELFDGSMAYVESGRTTFPLQLGHEWAGRVSAAGSGVDPGWLGRAVTGDTMLGCRACRRCVKGYQHLCAERVELGITDGRGGALAEKVVVPATSLHALPQHLGPEAGALVEPGGNALRAASAAGVVAGETALIAGPGTIGLLTAMFLRAKGVEVHLLGATDDSLAFARLLGFDQTWTAETLPDLTLDAVVDATNHEGLPARCVDLVEPGRRVVYVGLSAAPSLVDSRALALKDVTAVGILSASPGLAETIDHYAGGAVDPSPLVAATVGLGEVGDVLAGRRPDGAGPGPKIHIDPRT